MKKKIIYIVLILAVCLAIGFFYFRNTKEASTPTEVQEVDNIEKYGYILYDNKQDLYKEKFTELKDVLNQENIDEKRYAEIISELFVIDFYTLDNKVTNTDIGGLDFILKDIKDEFILAAKDTLYKYVENNVYGERVQELPEVMTTKIVSSESKNFTSDKINDELSYEIKVDITYKKDLEYPASVTLTLVHSDNKLYIVEVK